MMVRFADVDLEDEQKELLVQMVDAYRKSRDEFLLIKAYGGASIHHAGLAIDVQAADVRALVRYGFLALAGIGRDGSEQYDVAPEARRYYEWLKEQEGQPVERVEVEVRRLLDADAFRGRHPAAYSRWADAEAKLWNADATEKDLTNLGFACREAVQLLVTDLVEKHKPPDVETNPDKTINRVKSVAAAAGGSERVANLAEALVAYFEAVNGIFQRQLHGKQKLGDPLTWEDARRVIFQTAMVMFELDATFG